MSKTGSCVVVGIVAFLVGVFATRLVNRADDVKPVTRHGEAGTGDKASVSAREFAVGGMTCQGCVDSITAALTKIPGVESAEVSLHEKKATVRGDERVVPSSKIIAAVVAAGYTAELAKTAKEALPDRAAAAGKSPILVNITRGKNELHAVSMGLGLAQSALKDGRIAIVFLNVDAPAFAARDADKHLKFADFPPVQKMLADFIAKGGRVFACGHCSHLCKLEPKNMIDGVKSIGHGELFAEMPAGTVVFSY